MVGSQQTEDIINGGGNIFSEIASPERKAAFVTPYKKYVTSGSCLMRTCISLVKKFDGKFD